ncbi:hypothetical protein HDU78_001596 [Chytriomyces hyalinus]|nr:hypothetical protein HDU78_001596 [Chytriomyces hyalinus]
MKELLYGSAPVLAALSSQRRRMFKLFAEGDSTHAAAAVSLARAAKLPVHYTLPKTLSGASTHNGLALEVSPIQLTSLRALGPFDTLESCYDAFSGGKDEISFEFTQRPESPAFPLWLALDSIRDPMNLGAILRSASFFGLDGIVTTTTNTAPLSPVVSKASAGVLESFETLYSTKNLPSFLSASKEAGWTVFGTDIGAPASKVLNCWDMPSINTPVIVVMGSEGEGLRKIVSNQCNAHLLIPGGDSRKLEGKGSLDSLNVSVAAGILLSHLSRKHK